MNLYLKQRLVFRPKPLHISSKILPPEAQKQMRPILVDFLLAILKQMRPILVDIFTSSPYSKGREPYGNIKSRRVKVHK